MFNEGGSKGDKIDYLHSFVKRFESAEKRKPNNIEVASFLNQFENFQFDEDEVYTGFMNDYFIINVRTKTAVFNDWETDMTEISKINFDTMYKDYSSFNFLFSDQASFTLYAN
jgi:hypothetical protein